MVELRLRSESPALLASGADVVSQKGRKAPAMSAAAKKSRATRQAAQRAVGRSESAAIRFLVFEDNGGDYCWTILDGDGMS
jgi:hypothetical protein